jgi:hypothetical protein
MPREKRVECQLVPRAVPEILHHRALLVVAVGLHQPARVHSGARREFCHQVVHRLDRGEQRRDMEIGDRLIARERLGELTAGRCFIRGRDRRHGPPPPFLGARPCGCDRPRGTDERQRKLDADPWVHEALRPADVRLGGERNICSEIAAEFAPGVRSPSMQKNSIRSAGRPQKIPSRRCSVVGGRGTSSELSSPIVCNARRVHRSVAGPHTDQLSGVSTPGKASPILVVLQCDPG